MHGLLPCLTGHLLQHFRLQTILDACGVIEGRKGFKYLDEKGKDQGINVRRPAMGCSCGCWTCAQ